jgi:Anti-sigma-K factor rskA/Putative zinc-finger
MSVANEHEQWADAAGAYVLGAMPERERERFERHLAVCDRCRDEVDELWPAVEALPVASAPMRPPAALKDRIMAEVEREAALLAAAGPEADGPPPPRRRRWPRLGGLRLAPAAAAVLAAGVLAGFVLAGVGDESRTYRGTVAAPVAGASAELEVEDGEAVLVANDLPEPPPGDAYQVWIKRPGVEAPEPSVLFLPRNGSATAAVPGAEDAEAVLVTREPRRGSDAPSEQPVVTVPLT